MPQLKCIFCIYLLVTLDNGRGGGHLATIVFSTKNTSHISAGMMSADMSWWPFKTQNTQNSTFKTYKEENISAYYIYTQF